MNERSHIHRRLERLEDALELIERQADGHKRSVACYDGENIALVNIRQIARLAIKDNQDLAEKNAADLSSNGDDEYLRGYGDASRDSARDREWMKHKAWMDSVLMLVHYTERAKWTGLIGHKDAALERDAWWNRCLALASTKSADDIDALSAAALKDDAGRSTSDSALITTNGPVRWEMLVPANQIDSLPDRWIIIEEAEVAKFRGHGRTVRALFAENSSATEHEIAMAKAYGMEVAASMALARAAEYDAAFDLSKYKSETLAGSAALQAIAIKIRENISTITTPAPKIDGTFKNATMLGREETRQGPCLHGAIYGDSKGRFADGDVVTTSTILREEAGVYYTRNSIYKVDSWSANNGLPVSSLLANAARRVISTYAEMETGDGEPCPDIAALRNALEDSPVPSSGAELASMFPDHKASLHLTHNQHLAYYETIEQAIELGTYPDDRWVSPAQRAKALETGSVWELQWYPDTPVGSHQLLACDLADLLNAANPTPAPTEGE